MDLKRLFRMFLWLAAVLILISADQANIKSKNPASFSQEPQITKEGEQFLPEDDQFRGWKQEESIAHYNRESLYGYINGGAEIFLQYAFRQLTHAVYFREIQGSSQETIIEIYRMATPLDGFGIFSVNRSGGEQVSQKIDALNWISPSQINFVKENYFVNILGFDCSLEDLEDFASIVADNIPGESMIPVDLTRFPKENRIPGSEKYIQGPLAATGESVLLQAEFWRFEQTTRAYACRYYPHNSRAILIQFQMIPDSIEKNVQALFQEFLEDVETAGSEIKGKNAVGRFFIFNRTGLEAVLILGEVSLEAARSRLSDLLFNKHNDISTVSQKINNRTKGSKRGKNSLLRKR
jgi:hypothetical protein